MRRKTMITIDGKEYRTLPEQVEKNMKDIADLKTADSNIQNSINGLNSAVEGLRTTLNGHTTEIRSLTSEIYEINQKLVTTEEVRAIVDEELGVIVNGQY